MTIKEFIKKIEALLDKIYNFFKKIWWVVLIPIGAFFLTLFTKKSKRSDLKQEIKEIEKDIEKQTDKIEKETEDIQAAEEKIEQDIQKVEECIEQTAEKKDKNKISDFLPGLKK